MRIARLLTSSIVTSRHNTDEESTEQKNKQKIPVHRKMHQMET